MYREIIAVEVSELKEGMVLAENIYDIDGNILLASGIKLRQTYIEKIDQNFVDQVAIEHWVSETPEEAAKKQQRELIKQKKQATIERVRGQAKEKLVEAIDQMLDNDALNGKIISDIVKKIVEDILNMDEVVFHIDQLRKVDEYLFDHAINVTVLSVVVAICSGMNKDQLVELAMGSILHDIGKLFVDQDILNKPDVLTPQEFALIKHHSQLGYEVLRQADDISEKSARVALNHHEQVSGRGYPNGLKGDEIDLYSKIVSMSDVFDALTSDRVYNKKINPYKAMSYIVEKAGSHFDGTMVKSFVSAIGYYYPGAVVRVSSGEIGMVKGQSRYKPLLRMLKDANGKAITGYFEIDLSKNPSVRIQSILLADEIRSLALQGVQRDTIV